MAPVLNKKRADKWIQKLFEAKAVTKGGIVRRNREDVERNFTVAGLEREVESRGFRMQIISDQCVIDCSKV